LSLEYDNLIMHINTCSL